MRRGHTRQAGRSGVRHTAFRRRSRIRRDLRGAPHENQPHLAHIRQRSPLGEAAAVYQSPVAGDTAITRSDSCFIPTSGFI